MNDLDTVIFACSSLEKYVMDAQKKKTSYPVILPETVETVLAAMGFCGGALDSVSFSRRFVIPRVDDCVSLMLQTNDTYNPNPKEAGHLYMMEQNPAISSVTEISLDNSL